LFAVPRGLVQGIPVTGLVGETLYFDAVSGIPAADEQVDFTVARKKVLGTGKILRLNN
jgi:hypothetical protein